MTPQEHAEKVVKDFAVYLNPSDVAGYCRTVIAAEINAAVEEAETKERMMHGLMVAAFDQRDKAKAEAYNEVLKSADRCKCRAGCCPVCDIANDIRARAAEVGK